MKKISFLFNLFMLTVSLLLSTVIAAQEIKIGEQIWKVKNLNVDQFLNGDLISEAKTEKEWAAACQNKQPAWCYYDNDPANA